MTSRSFIGTLHLNTLSEEELKNIEWDGIYQEKILHTLAGQLETCPTTGRLHWQLFIKFKKPIRGKAAGKCFPWDWLSLTPQTYGEEEWMANYSKKAKTATPGTYFFYGKEVSQGSRTDLNDIRDEIVRTNGRGLDDIILDRPMLYHQYGRTMNKLKEIVMKKNKRTECPKGIWLYGDTGVGKSWQAFKKYAPEYKDYYPWMKDEEFQENYEQQECVIINEFRGQIKYSNLLEMLEEWDTCYVKKKNMAPIPFNSKCVLVTSALHPSEVYCNLSINDKLDQLLRRFEIIRLN